MNTMGLGEDVRQRLFALAFDTPPAHLMVPLRDFAREVLSQEYPREQLMEDFEALRSELHESDEESREDAVMDVMDFLYGWSSRPFKL